MNNKNLMNKKQINKKRMNKSVMNIKTVEKSMHKRTPVWCPRVKQCGIFVKSNIS